jgi:RND family efflux transporter MFP subunit
VRTERFTGIVEARQTSLLSAKSLGRIERVHVDIGDHVQAETVLVELDRDQLEAERRVLAADLAAAKSQLLELNAGPRLQEIEQAEAAVAEAQANVELRQANYQRMVRLRDASAISVQDYDESRYAVKAADAQLASAQKALELLRVGTRAEQIDRQSANVMSLEAQLDRIEVQLADLNIEAPFGGHIQARFADAGAVVSPGQAILELVETDALEIHVGLPPELTANLETCGLRVSVEGRIIPVEILRIAPSIDQRTRTRELVLKVDAAADSPESGTATVAIGTAVEVAIDIMAAHEGQWVRTQSLTAGPRGLWALYVAVPLMEAPLIKQSVSVDVATHKIERRPVELLRNQGAWSEVRGPLESDEAIVVEGTHLVVPGQLVQCRPASFDDTAVSERTSPFSESR